MRLWGTDMKKNTRIALWIVVAIAIIAGFVWWQMWQLGRGLRTIHADEAQEVLLSALSAEVLAPDLGENGQSPSGSGPLLDQRRENPALTHQRYLLVMTWVHASQIFKAVDNWSAFEGKILSSNSLTNIPTETRVDGWTVPYCIWVEPSQVVFMSSGGTGATDCNTLRQTVQEASALHGHEKCNRDNLL